MMMSYFTRLTEPTTNDLFKHEMVLSRRQSHNFARIQSSMIVSNRKRVIFQENRNAITLLSCTKEYDSILWYSNEELNDMMEIVRVANLAVNDTCGDLDDTDRVALCREAIIEGQRQNDNLVQISKIYSDESVKLARLHAQLLEKDIFTDEGPMIYEELWDLVRLVMFHGGDQDDDDTSTIQYAARCSPYASIGPQDDDAAAADDDDDESMGTIDDWPEESWEKDLHSMDNLDHEDNKGKASIQVAVERMNPLLEKEERGSRIAVIENTGVDIMIQPNRLIGEPSHVVTPGTLTHDSRKTTTDANNAKSFSKEGLRTTTQIIKPVHLSSNDQEFFVLERPCPSSPGHSEQTSNKRPLETGEDDSPISCSESSKRHCGISTENPTEGRLHVAHALISLARWEFRSCRLPFQS